MSNEQMKRCPFCAEEINFMAKKCRYCGEIIDPTMRSGSSSPQNNVSPMTNHITNNPTEVYRHRIAYILFGIFLGCFGVHNFYAGYTGRGVTQLLIVLLSGWLIIPLIAVCIWNIVEICTITKDAKGNPLI